MPYITDGTGYITTEKRNKKAIREYNEAMPLTWKKVWNVWSVQGVKP